MILLNLMFPTYYNADNLHWFIITEIYNKIISIHLIINAMYKYYIYVKPGCIKYFKANELGIAQNFAAECGAKVEEMNVGLNLHVYGHQNGQRAAVLNH